MRTDACWTSACSLPPRITIDHPAAGPNLVTRDCTAANGPRKRGRMQTIIARDAARCGEFRRYRTRAVSGSVAQAAILVVFPVAAAAVGSAVAAWRRPGPKLTSGIQHFAGGVVLAAVAGEVLPELRSEGRLAAAVLGFTAGVSVVLAVGAFSRRTEAALSSTSQASATSAARRAPRLPVGLLVTVGIDLLIDGLLVGLGATLGATAALVLTIALTTEILFLGVAVCVELLELGIPRFRAAAIAAALGLSTAVGALAGAALLGGASPSVLATVLAFGCAALLYLVVEELLVEAHEEAETPLLGAMFFLGFIGLYVLAELGG